MKLGLGTVRFGQTYGISQTTGVLDAAAVREILDVAAAGDVAYLDTAPAYGDSERILGETLEGAGSFRVVTKTPVFRRALTADDGRAVSESFARSLDRLRLPAVYGLLVHDACDLLGPGGGVLFGALERLRQGGHVDRIGVSVYDAAQIDAVLERFDVGLVQLPLSVLDQRLIRGGQLARLKQRGIEIHARSIFLQGLLLMDPDSLPGYFAPLSSHLAEYRAYIGQRGLTPVQAAVGFVEGIDEVDVLIVGVESLEQLREIGEAVGAGQGPGDWARFGIDDPRFVDPSKWEK